MPNVQLIVFDLGQVLVRVQNGWREACRAVGIEVDEAEPAPATIVQMAKIVERYDCGLIDLNQFAREIAPLRGLTCEQIVQVHESYLLGSFPGASELLNHLAANGHRTACLSNTNLGHWQSIQDPSNPNFLPLNLLTYRFASHLIGACKPSEAAYEHVERVTRTAPQSTLFFDDRAENVLAACRRGWVGEVIAINGDPISQVRRHLASRDINL